MIAHNCRDPNLQNIPRAKGNDDAKFARNCFVADRDSYLLELDFSQIELRIAAMLSGDAAMTEDFKRRIDIHRNNARACCKIAWGIDQSTWDSWTKDQQDPYRSKIKTATFGRLYGKHPRALAKEWGVDVREVEAIVEGRLATEAVLAGHVHVNGSRDRAYNVTIDGIDANESSVGNASNNVYRLNPDNVQEYKVTTNNATAEEGRNSGASVSIATRSGTNAFHGTAFEFLRNKALNSNAWFANALGNPKPDMKLNQFGFEFGRHAADHRVVVGPRFGDGQVDFLKGSDGGGDSRGQLAGQVARRGWRLCRRGQRNRQPARRHETRREQAAQGIHGADDSTARRGQAAPRECGRVERSRASYFWMPMPTCGARRTSLAKKNLPSIGTIMICTLSDSRSAMIF